MTHSPGSSPRITAVIPTFNRGALVVRAVESVFAQTRPADEVIVVDDGSADDTANRLNGFGSRVRAFFQSNLGAAAARNLGTKAATGEWIAFLDDDDAWAPDHLERVTQAIEATHGSAGFYFRDAERSSPSGPGSTQWRQAGLAAPIGLELRQDATAWAMLPTQPFMLQASVFRRALLLQIGGLDERLTRRHDTDLFLRTGLGRSACAVAGSGVTISADDGSGQRLTERFDGRSRIYWDCTVRLYEKALIEHPELDPLDKSELGRRLGAAHLEIAKLGLRSRDAWLLGASLGRALRIAPALTVRRLARKAAAHFRGAGAAREPRWRT